MRIVRRFLSSRFAVAALLAAAIGIAACQKKDRLSNSTFDIHVSPPAAGVPRNGSVELVAVGRADGRTVDINPTWTLSTEDSGTLNTDLGSRVVFQANNVSGYVEAQAMYDGVVGVAQIAVGEVTVPGGTFHVYSDAGLPSGGDIRSDIIVGDPMVLTETTGDAAEGNRFQRAVAGTNGSWGVTLDRFVIGQRRNLQAYSGGSLRFSLRLGRPLIGGEFLTVNVEDAFGIMSNTIDVTEGLNGASTGWQTITMPISGFTGGNPARLAATLVPFAIVASAVSSPLTFDVDDVAWLP